MFFVQVKRRKRLPAGMWDWLHDICAHAMAHGKIGVLVLTKPGQHDRDGIVCLRYGDFIDLHGAVKPGESEE